MVDTYEDAAEDTAAVEGRRRGHRGGRGRGDADEGAQDDKAEGEPQRANAGRCDYARERQETWHHRATCANTFVTGTTVASAGSAQSCRWPGAKSMGRTLNQIARFASKLNRTSTWGDLLKACAAEGGLTKSPTVSRKANATY